VPDDSEESVPDEHASVVPRRKHLVTMISTKGKTPKEVAAEVVANFLTNQEVKQDSEPPSRLHG